MPSQIAKAGGKKRMSKGFEVCPHTCTDDSDTSGCMNVATGTPLWLKEGSSCARHAKSPGKHMECTPACPGHQAVIGAGGVRSARMATQEELRQYIPRIRTLPKFLDDKYVAFLLDVSVPDLHRLYEPASRGSQSVSISLMDIDRDADREDIMMEDPDVDIMAGHVEPETRTGKEGVVMGGTYWEVEGEEEEEEDEEDDGDGDEAREEYYKRAGLYPRGRSEQSSISASSIHSRLPVRPQAQVPESGNVLQTLQLLYVPDPSRARLGLRNAVDLAFTDRTITQEVYSLMKATIPYYVFSKRRKGDIEMGNPDSEGKRMKVRISEWVCVSFELVPLHRDASSDLVMDYGPPLRTTGGWRQILRGILHGVAGIQRADHER